MSDDPNNSVNSGNTITIPIAGNGAANGGWVTIGGRRIAVPNGVTYFPAQQQQNQQMMLPNIELDLPNEKKKVSAGCSCKKCKEFFEYAEPNQSDGTLVCWACRHGY